MSGYSSGTAIERAVVHALKARDYVVARAAGSKGGLGDVVAVGHGYVLVINVKRTRPPGPTERRALLAVADLLPGCILPIVAIGPASSLSWRLLTGPGAQDWCDWEPGEARDPWTGGAA